MKKNSTGAKFKRRRVKGRSITQFASKKNGSPIRVTSYLEKGMALLMEFESRIEKYGSEVESINVGEQRYTADFSAMTFDGESIHLEVHHSNLIDEEYLAKLEKAKDYYHERGNEFKVLSEKSVTKERVENLHLLYPYLDIDPSQFLHYLSFLPEQTTFNELPYTLKRLSRNQSLVDCRLAALSLIAHQFYWFDDLSAIKSDTKIYKYLRA